MKLMVFVGDDHIARGERGDALLCPITHAVRAALVEAGYDAPPIVFTTPTAIGLRLDSELIWARLPLKARRFIQEFDNDWAPGVFNFELDLEDLSL